MKPVEEALLKACLPYQLVGGLAFADYEEVKDVAAFLKLAINPRDDLAFGRIVNKPARGLGPAAEFAIIARNPSSALPFHEVCQSVRSRADMVHDAQWREGLAKLSGVLMALDSAAADPRCTSAELVEIVLHDNGAGYEAFVSKGRDKKAARRKMDNLRALQRLAEEEPSPVEMVDRVLLSTDKLAALEPGKIRLSTIHSSKGLEWEHVYLPAFASDVIPAPRAAAAPCLGTPGDPWEGPVGGGVEEERRLAHVALTRAKQSVTISSYLSRAGRKCHPSVFLPESGLEDILSIDAYEDGLSRAKGSMKSVRAGRSGFKRGKGF
jgi:DNA helicase-2/ATP-dependent DNA helicase PcrA